MRLTYSVLLLAAAAGVASAQPIISFGYTELSGSYSVIDATSGTMTAGAVDNGSGGLQTAGDVTRLVGSGGTANFDDGFKSIAGDVSITINVTGISGTSANGAGSFTLTDADGSTISGDISGTFSVAGFVFFNGNLSNVVITAGDNDFEGTTSGSFNTTFANPGPYTGAIVQLTFGGGTGFTNFAGSSTEAHGLILPAPGAAALIGLGGLVAVRRKR